MNTNDFDLVAPVYDRLARIVFGTSLLKAQVYHLNVIAAHHKVLILGGGTGKILEGIPRCKRVDFFDVSSKMLQQAKMRTCSSPVIFMEDNFMQWEFAEKYDVIICPFFLDCFHSKHLKWVTNQIKSIVANQGLLLVADFHLGRKKWLIAAMYFFFRLLAKMEAHRLLNIHQYILEAGFSLESEQSFCNQLIFSRLYRNL